MEYYIKHKNIIVAEVDIEKTSHTITDIIKLYNEEHLPVRLSRINKTSDNLSINRWLKSRAIPESREGIEKQLGKIGLANTNELSILGYGLNLTDHYWICPVKDDRDWHEVNYFENGFSKDVGDLLCDNIKNESVNLLSPDSTLNGNLEKRWVADGNKRYLIKGGSGDTRQEPFNECIASELMSVLGIKHVHYHLVVNRDKYYSACDCMVDTKKEYINAHYVYNYFSANNDMSKYDRYINTCERKGLRNIKDEVNKMIGIDYIIANTDRHHGNFGIIRNADTLEWIDAAPLFDNGTSLWCKNINIISDRKTDSRAFDNTNEEQIKHIKDFLWYKEDKLKDIPEKFGEFLIKNVLIDNTRRDALVSALSDRLDMFQSIKKEYIRNMVKHKIMRYGRDEWDL